MASQSVQRVLNWNGYADNFSVVFNELLEQKEMVDVTLVADGYMFNAHRLVLSALSPYFRHIFAQAPANQQAYVFIKGVSKQTMADLITFIYTGEVNIDPKSMANFLQTSNELKIKGLANIKYPQSSIQEQSMQSSDTKPIRNGIQFQTTGINSVQRSKTANNETDSANQPLSNGSTIYGNAFNFEQSSNLGDEKCSGMETNGTENYSCDLNNYELMMDQKYDTDINQWNVEYDNDVSNVDETTISGSNNGLPNPKRARHNNGEYEIVADIRTDARGREYLFINNYTFWKQGKPNGRNHQRWRCNKCNSHKCRAAANTMDVDGIHMMKINFAEHTHEY